MGLLPDRVGGGGGFEQDGGLEAREVDDFGRSAGGGVECGVEHASDLQRSGDEFGAEEGVVIGLAEFVPAEGGEADADRLFEVVGPLFCFGELEPLLHVTDGRGCEGLAKGEPPDRAGFSLEPIVEPLELYAQSSFPGADAGEAEVDVGFGEEDAMVLGGALIDPDDDRDMDILRLGGNLDDFRGQPVARKSKDIARFNGNTHFGAG